MRSSILLLLLFSTVQLICQNAWINEIHYDDSGADQDEVVEIVIENPENYTLSDFEVYLYNGLNGTTYNDADVSSFIVGSAEGDFTFYYWYPASMQNGGPDGLALVYAGSVISGQFLSYEGSFTATDGPANGLISTDMTVSENGEPDGQSLQLSGTGTQYTDFGWQPPASNTTGALNNGQTFGVGGNQGPDITNIAYTPTYPSSSESVAVTATVTDDNEVTAVVCKWGTNDGGPYSSSITMSNITGDNYQTDSDIPSQPDGTIVYFVIEATDDENETTTSIQQNYAVDDVTIVINEILADPDATSGDANGDGTVSTSQDEFVEIVNSTSTAIDISHYTLSDGVGVRHTYPGGTIIQPHDAVIVFGGGEPAGFDYYDVQTSSSGTLGLNNSGDEVIIKDASGTTVVSYVYGSEAGSNQSITRDPDITGNFVQHSLATGSGGASFSPNKFINANWFKEVTTWNGSQGSNNWNDNANWSNNTPTTDSRAVIPMSLTFYPTLASAGQVCNSLLIEANASVVGVDNLTINGYASIHCSIDEYTTDDDGFHFLSAPVSGFQIAGSDFEPLSGSDDFYDWDEASNTWLNYYGGNFPDTEFATGKAYLVAYASAQDGEFYGLLNGATTTKNMSYSIEQGEGWNLIGNPFPSAIDWDLLNKSADIHGSVYVLRGSDNTYISWNGSVGDLTDGHIPMNNGFFAKAGSSGQTITMEADDQVHGSLGFLKKKSNNLPDHSLKLSVKHEDFINNTYIQFREGATLDFDDAVDTYKLFGSSRGPQLYTSLSAQEYAINCVPFTSTPFELSMGFITGSSGSYSISADGINTFIDGNFEVFLEDRLSGDLINLGIEDYLFTAGTDGNENRFLLHFYGLTEVDKSFANEDVSIYSSKKTVFIRFMQSPQKVSLVEIFNSMGKQIYSNEIETGTLTCIQLRQKPGVYIVRLYTGKNTVTRKVFIN